jgi:hypothetical protein
MHVAAQALAPLPPGGCTAPCSAELPCPCISPPQDALLAQSAALIQAFVQSGGGLITGAQAWYWSYTKPVEEHPSNALLAPMCACCWLLS